VLNGVRQFGSTVDAPAGVSVQNVSGDVAGFWLFLGTAAVLLWIGEWVQGRRRQPDEQLPERPYSAMLIGLLVAFVLGFVPMVTAVISLFGLGAVTLVMWRTLRGRRTPAPQLRREAAPLAG
jgi:membrane protein implicated in regulation of membrane protease activity